MTTPTDLGASIYNELRTITRNSGGNFAEVLMRYKLERTLARLLAGPYRNKVVLKGGLVLAAYSTRRPTKDIDSMLRDLALNDETVRAICTAITDQPADDGLLYDLNTLKITEIREESEYTGYRATMRCLLHTDTQPVAFDFSAGDPVAPPPRKVVLPAVLGEDVTIAGYPPAMILAEKYVTALDRGQVNTRWRDFTDIALLARSIEIDADDLRTALHTVAAHRGVPLAPLADAVDVVAYGQAGQTKYAAWRRKQGLAHLAPEQFAEALARTVAFIDPVASNQVAASATWNTITSTWDGQDR